MLESLIKNLNQDIALLQLRIQRDKDAGFNDMARLLETMAIQFFRALGIANLESKNQIRVNFPAIDSADDEKDGGIAVQVTSVADARKIKKTITTFEKTDSAGQSLLHEYASLYIFGFCKISDTVEVPSYCKVVGPGFFVNKLVDLDDEEAIQTIVDSIRRHVDYSSLHPYSDIECLKIVLGYVGRNAVRHYVSCEGNFDDMTKGLKEISELIGKGTVNRKQKSKAHHEFQDQEISRFLLNVLDHIGAITATVNSANRNGIVCLSLHDVQTIDGRKRAITTLAQQIALSYDIAMPLGMHEVGKPWPN
ncbi:SMEK domain-containing protein [Advenella sp. FME57]|uniref:SMEK domain-containing protein n=1 Tax=Advenella sp. FME57 TaxID=2742604 RepID=UPI001867C92B|nr:SMEK domain-containing protein [Advenella sp. FME57]